MTPTAVRLPGQGSQVPGTRDAVASARPDLPAGVLAKLAPRGVPGAEPVELHGVAPQRAA